jgi:hypothetical protein
MRILAVAVERENGEVVEKMPDERNLLCKPLPVGMEQPNGLLGLIDPYGDTVFNRLQIDQFLAEWATVAERARNDEEKAIVIGVAALAERCRAGAHLYLKFIGN